MTDNQEHGRSPTGRATRASTEPQERLGHSASVPNAGDFALTKGWNSIEVREIEKVTPKLVKLAGRNWPRQLRHDEIVATMPDRQSAEKLAQSISGAMGERNARIRKAQNDYDARRAAAHEAYERTKDRLIASAGEAGTAATVKQGAVHEHAVPKADAQGPSQ